MSISNKQPSFVHHHSTQPTEAVKPIDIPFCVARNPAGYNLSFNNVRSSNNALQTANMQSQLFNESLSALHAIPTTFLREAIFEDILTSNEVILNAPMLSTVLGITVRNRSLFLHTAGRNLDQIVLRDSLFTLSNNVRPQPGFILPVGQGSQIKQILTAGSMDMFTTPHIIARSDNTIYHIKAINVDDQYCSHYNKKLSHTIEKNEQKAHYMHYESILLDTIQKYSIGDIYDMSTSSHTISWSYANILMNNSTLYNWTPTQGVIKCNNGKSILPLSIVNNSTDIHNIASKVRIKSECSTHPMLSYLTYKNTILLYDQRKNGSAFHMTTIQNTLSRDKNNGDDINKHIKCIKQHHSNQNQLLISHNKKVSIFDVRNTRSAISEKMVCDTHESIKYRQFGQNMQTGIYLGASKHSSQMIAHTLSSNTQSYSNNSNLNNLFSVNTNTRQNTDNTSNSSNKSKASGGSSSGNGWSLLGAATLHGCGSAQSWSHTSFSTMDITYKHQTDTLCNPISLIGFDLIPSNKNRYESVSTKSTVDNSNIGNDNSDNIACVSNGLHYDGILIQQYSIGDVYAQYVQYNNDNNDTTTTSAATAATTTGRQIMHSKLPCGYVSHSGSNNTDNNSDIQTTAAITTNDYKIQPKTTYYSYNGYKVSLLNTTLTTYDIRHKFPMSNSSIMPFISEDTLRGFDKVKIILNDLRQDYPRVYKQKITLIDPDKAVLEDYEDVHEYLLSDGIIEYLIMQLSTCNYSITLYEIHQMIVDNTKKEQKQAIKLSMLRQYLQNNSDFIEKIINTSSMLHATTVHKQHGCNCIHTLSELFQTHNNNNLFNKSFDTSKVKLCSNSTCILSHILVYRLNESVQQFTQLQSQIMFSGSCGGGRSVKPLILDTEYLQQQSDDSGVESGQEQKVTTNRKYTLRTKYGRKQHEKVKIKQENEQEKSSFSGEEEVDTQNYSLFGTSTPVKEKREKVKKGHSGVSLDLIATLNTRWDSNFQM